MSEKKTVLISGVCGMIGSAIAERLQESHFVVGLDNLEGGRIENAPHFIRFIEMSCLDARKVERVYEAYRPQFVIHCAAMAAENLSHNCRAHVYSNNLLSEAIMRNGAINHDVQCMVSMSSIAVMGHQQPPFDEETPPDARDPYAVSKLAGELDAKAAKDFHDLNYVIFRAHNTLGLRQNLADRYRNVASIFIRAIIENKPLPIFGDGKQTRAFSPVSYVADVIAASIERPGTWNTTYNLGSDEPISILSLKFLLEDIVGRSLDTEYHEHRKEAVHAHMTHDKVRAAFPDIQPTESLEDVLRAMLQEARKHPLPPMQAGPPIEVEKNLPAAWRTPA
jgi:UDP-glucose 4-epimerase